MRYITTKAQRHGVTQSKIFVNLCALRVLVVTLLFCFIAFSGYAQITDTGFSLVKLYKGDISGAAVDNLDNLYIISSTGQVKKLDLKAILLVFLTASEIMVNSILLMLPIQ